MFIRDDGELAGGHLESFQPSFARPAERGRRGQNYDPVAGTSRGAATCLIDVGQQCRRALAELIHLGRYRIRLGQSNSGKHQIGERAGHHKTMVIGTRVEDNKPLKPRVR
jgi:hypothetical protein